MQIKLEGEEAKDYLMFHRMTVANRMLMEITRLIKKIDTIKETCRSSEDREYSKNMMRDLCRVATELNSFAHLINETTKS